MNYYLGVDNGGTTTKAALFDEDGSMVSSASESTPAIYPRPDFVEIDMDEMWLANCRVIRNVIGSSGVDPASIRAVAICGHGKGLYLWGMDGKPVRNGILSTDNRAYEYPVKWRKDGTEERAFAYTCQRIMACQPVPLLAWLRDNEPGSLEKTKYIFAAKDHIRFRLTGEAYAERTDYSGDGLIDLRTGEKDPRILEIFGLGGSNDALTPLRDPTDLCGYVSREAAELTGLAEGTPVAGGMFDINACALSASVTDARHVCMVAGTWSINELVLPAPVTDGRVLMNSLFCIPGRYLVEGSSATSAGNLSWYLRNLAQDSEDIYAEINREVSSISPLDPCPIFLPFLMASNVQPNAKACFVGINAYHTRAHIVRSIYEGVAFCHRWHYERLKACMERDPDSIRLVGGAARSKEWVQIFADVMKCPIETSTTEETGAHGCAIAASVAAGDHPDIFSALNAMTHIAPAVLPREDHFEIYDKKYALYKKVIDLLGPLWDDLSAIY